MKSALHGFLLSYRFSGEERWLLPGSAFSPLDRVCGWLGSHYLEEIGPGLCRNPTSLSLPCSLPGLDVGQELTHSPFLQDGGGWSPEVGPMLQ